jgi:hypothetical protein
MAWSPSQSGNMNPGRFFPGCSGTANEIVIPYSALESYNASTSGDIRELTYSFLDVVTSGINALSAQNRPTKFNISRTYNSLNETTVRKTYTVTTDLNISNVNYDVVDE